MNFYNDLEARINEKIDALSDHSKYDWLRKYTDYALIWFTCAGFYQIKAEDFLKRIDAASLSLILDWLDGKNMLEWELIHRETMA